MKEFVIGDKVKYVSGKYGDTESNPLWNGCYGKIEGTIIENSYGWLTVDDRKILRVHYSHGKGDIPEKVANKIRGQLKLSPLHFEDLVKCPLTREDYLEILKQKGFF